MYQGKNFFKTPRLKYVSGGKIFQHPYIVYYFYISVNTIFEHRSLLSKLIFILSFLLKRYSWNSGTVKHKIITRKWADELPHELPNDLRRKWGDFKAVYLSFHWLNNSWSRGFELATRKVELVTPEFELLGLNLPFWSSACAFKFSTRNS